MAEIENVDDLEFKWGRKSGAGWENKEAQHYESFTFDGIEYTLYDCVYMHTDGEPEPYIGKLIGIWETAGKKKEVNVQWFFCPFEILTWLGDQLPKEKEIFLATGEGIGIADVSPLEAIAGKCDVVCISEDSRNWKLSEEEIKMADYIFYRTFDVGLHNISDKIGDKIGGLEVKYVFNTKKKDNVINLRSPPPMGIGVNNDVARNGQNKPTKSNSHLKSVDTKDVKGVLTNSECILDAKPVIKSAIKSPALTKTNVRPQIATFGEEVEMCKVDTTKNEVQKAASNKLKAKERQHSDALDDKPMKKPRVDNATKSFRDNIHNCAKNLVTQGDNSAKIGLASQKKTKYGVKLNKDNTNNAKYMTIQGDNSLMVALAIQEKTTKYGDKNPLNRDEGLTPSEGVNFFKDSRGPEDGPSNRSNKVVGLNSEGVNLSKDFRGPEDWPSNRSKNVVGLDSVCANDSQDSKDKPSNQVKKHVGFNGARAKDSQGSKDKPSNQVKKDIGFNGALESACANDSRGLKDEPSNQVKKHVDFNGARAKDSQSPKDKPSNQVKKDIGFNGARAKDSQGLEDGLSNPLKRLKKVAHVDGPSNQLKKLKKVIDDDAPSNQLEKLKKVADVDGPLAKDLKITNHVGRTCGPTMDFVELNSFYKKENALANTRKFSGSKLSKVSTMEFLDNDGKIQCKVTNNSKVRSGWWSRDVKLRNAKGIVLLLNLDPEYTSNDVEEIIQDAFQIRCTAVVVQRTRISSPNSGQALVRFEGSEATGMVINKLDKGCLMLPHGRPLVGIAAPPLNSEEKHPYFGHLVIDNLKLQGSMKDAVSTSHCSQPNSIEYEMAMEWRLLEAKVDQCWENLYKLHAKEIGLVEANLKSK